LSISTNSRSERLGALAPLLNRGLPETLTDLTDRRIPLLPSRRENGHKQTLAAFREAEDRRLRGIRVKNEGRPGSGLEIPPGIPKVCLMSIGPASRGDRQLFGMDLEISDFFTAFQSEETHPARDRVRRSIAIGS